MNRRVSRTKQRIWTFMWPEKRDKYSRLKLHNKLILNKLWKTLKLNLFRAKKFLFAKFILPMQKMIAPCKKWFVHAKYWSMENYWFMSKWLVHTKNYLFHAKNDWLMQKYLFHAKIIVLIKNELSKPNTGPWKMIGSCQNDWFIRKMICSCIKFFVYAKIYILFSFGL